MSDDGAATQSDEASAAKPPTIEGLLEEILPLINQDLTAEDVPLAHRPLDAAIKFVLGYVLEVQDSGQREVTPSDPIKFVGTRWFAKIYAAIENWYRALFGDAMDQAPDDSLLGVTVIAGAAFAIRIPFIRRRPGPDQNTLWIAFPDGVRADEKPVEWISSPPNLQNLPPAELRDAENFAHEVAGALRFIRSGLTAVSCTDSTFDGFRAGIMPRLVQAAKLLLEQGAQPVQQAYWELHFACEVALKALLQQHTGSFQETHDLFRLYDSLPPSARAFPRDLLKRLPRWEEATAFRYGQGTNVSRAECLESYRAALGVVSGAVRTMKKLGIGEAEFLIQRPPWKAAVHKQLVK